MEKVVIIGASEFQNPLILKAKEMGYETHVFAWKSGDIGEKTADFFYPISIIEKDEILNICKKIKPSAIISIGSDLAVITVNYIAKKLKLIGNNPKDSLICTNKYKMREAFKSANIKTPKFIFVDKEKVINIDNFKFPIIVKPTDRSGSRGITKINNKNNNIDEAIDIAINNSFEKKAIVEEYIDGDEFSCECISYRGEHTCLAITRKYTTGPPHFIETAHLQPPFLSIKEQSKIKEEVYKGLDALNIKYGASHTEFKLDKNNNMRIIEIGARMGGDCIGSDLVKISTGYDFLKMVIDVALGKKPKFIKIEKPSFALIKFIFSEEDYKNFKMIKEKHSKNLYCVSKIKKFDHLIIDSSSRYGFYILDIKNKRDLSIIMNVLGEKI